MTPAGGKTKVALVGPMASGKSAVSRALARLTGWPRVDTDELVESSAGQSIADLFANVGEATFRDYERAALIEALNGDSNRIIATGGGIVLREDNRTLLSSRAKVVWLWAPAGVLAKRIRDPSTRPLFAARAPLEVLEELLAARHDFYDQVADIHIDMSSNTPHEIAVRIIEILGVNE